MQSFKLTDVFNQRGARMQGLLVEQGKQQRTDEKCLASGAGELYGICRCTDVIQLLCGTQTTHRQARAPRGTYLASTLSMSDSLGVTLECSSLQ